MIRPEELPAALAADPRGSFEQLVLAYQDRLYGFGMHLSGRRQDAEEIAQEAFIRAFRALERYPAEQIRTLKLRPWLYQIALNVFRNRVRGDQPRLESLDGVEEGPAALQTRDEEGPERHAEASETRARLRALLLALPERYRIAVVLRHVEGLSYAEIATLLGQPVGTVKANVHRGTRALRELLVAPAKRAVGVFEEVESDARA